MKLKSTCTLFCIVVFEVIGNLNVTAQEPNIQDYFPVIEILESNNPAEGYYFMGSKGLTAPNASHYIAIIDNYGTPVFFRKMTKATSSFRVLPNGKLAYLHGVPRKWYLLNDMLNVHNTKEIIGYKPNGHDWEFDQNGHLLLLGEAKSTFDMSTLVEGGNPNAEILDLIVQEFDQNFNLKYSWNSADHFNILDGNELSQYLDFTEKQIDYVHANGITCDSDTSFLISNRHMDEITKIDRRTGEIIWRLGGKNNQFTFINDELRFSHQHSIRSLGNGHFLLFDNGNLHVPQISSSIEYVINETEKTATLVKRYYRNPNVYSNHGGATQRIHNGNTLISWGTYWPSITEFHPDGSVALEWDFTKHSFCPRIEKYKWETKVFVTNKSEINFDIFNNDTIKQNIWLKNNYPDTITITTLNKHTPYFGLINSLPLKIATNDSVEITIWYNAEGLQTGFVSDVLTIASDTENQRIARQIEVTGKKWDDTKPVANLVSQVQELPVDGRIQIDLSEPIRLGTGEELTHFNIDSFIELKEENEQGEKVTFNANISTNKKSITVVPEKKLELASNYFIQIKDGLTDYSGNELGGFEEIFSTVLTSSKQLEKSNQFVLFPNPAQNKITLTFYKNYQAVSYQLFNASGMLQQYKKLENIYPRIEIDLNEQNPGLYILVIHADNLVFSEKFIKY